MLQYFITYFILATICFNLGWIIHYSQLTDLMINYSFQEIITAFFIFEFALAFYCLDLKVA
jgi:hypothetical protein